MRAHIAHLAFLFPLKTWIMAGWMILLQPSGSALELEAPSPSATTLGTSNSTTEGCRFCSSLPSAGGVGSAHAGRSNDVPGYNEIRVVRDYVLLTSFCEFRHFALP